MGIEFRSGGYTRRVRMGGRTIKDGEAAAIWDVRGRHRQVIGPSREWMWCSTIRFLTRHKAESSQYIRVHHRHGKVEHLQGPTELYENPALHDEVKVENGIHLRSETECIIVYRETVGQAAAAGAGAAHQDEGKIADADEAVKRVVKGPMLFIPSVGEVVHKFQWSASADDGSKGLKAKKDIFQVVDTHANRSWAICVPITTSDAMEVSAHLEFAYHLDGLEKVARYMDPVARMHAGLIADAQRLGAGVTSEQLRAGQQEAVTAKLASMESYANLVTAAAGSGLRVSGVRVLGIKFSEVLQEQADREQQLAAGLRAELAEKTQRRELLELELEDERTKIEQEAALERRRVEVRAALEAEAHEAKLAGVQRALALQEAEFEAQHQQRRARDEAALAFLRGLKEEGVDVTKFMCSGGGRLMGAPTLAALAVGQPGAPASTAAAGHEQAEQQ